VSWFLSPVLSGATSVLLFVLVRRFILDASNPVARGLQCLPLAYGVTVIISVFSVLHDGPPCESHTDCMLLP
jgi:sodium-dependent phosphate transporter